MDITFSDDVKTSFPDLLISVSEVGPITVRRKDPDVEKMKREIEAEARKIFDIEDLKDIPTIRLLRDFYWKLGIDPTKTRPSSEALIRRILNDREIPIINTAVDNYNIASIRTLLPFAGFDKDKLVGDLHLRFANEGESFLGIGMDKPVILTGKELVFEDEESLVAIYPYRDADRTKITLETKNVLLIACGVPGIDKARLDLSLSFALGLTEKHCKITSDPAYT